MKLSIIIPYYNTLDETKELLKVLVPQLTKETEVLIIDDGCHEEELDNLGTTVIHLKENSGGASVPRNIGLDFATGKYIAFIDSDDMISNDYIEKILNAISSDKDIIYLSWKSKIHDIKMILHPPKWNCAVWCRVYKKEIIGNIRFDKNLKIAEDWKFNQQIKPKTSCCIKKTIYYYNNGRKGSLING